MNTIKYKYLTLVASGVCHETAVSSAAEEALRRGVPAHQADAYARNMCHEMVALPALCTYARLQVSRPLTAVERIRRMARDFNLPEEAELVAVGAFNDAQRRRRVRSVR